MTDTCRFVTLAVATVNLPAARTGTLPAMSHLASLAMLVAERDAAGTWTFALEHRALVAGDSEDDLLVWAMQAMPTTGTVLGWQLAERIVAPLLDAGTFGDPAIGRAFLDRLMRLVTIPSIDMAVHHGGAGAPDLATVCAGQNIAMAPLTPDALQSAWAFGDIVILEAEVAREAIAVWQLWLAESNGRAGAASTAFAAWLEAQAN